MRELQKERKNKGARRKRTGLWMGVVAALLIAGAFWVVKMRDKDGEMVSPPYCLLAAASVEEGLRVEVAGENLMLQKGVRVWADSQENRELSPKWVKDGVSDPDGRRWSSANDWENNEHWLAVEFPQETTVGYVKIFWERQNACAYALEYSLDGKIWEQAAAFENAPSQKEQGICLQAPVNAKQLRLHITEVTKEETDLSLYYQNVSVIEMEVYGGVLDTFTIKRPVIEAGTGRRLEIPTVPEGYRLTFAGADYENLVRHDGQIADTLSPVWVEMGFCLEREGTFWELPGMAVCIPAGQQEESSVCLPHGVSVREWRGEEGAGLSLDVLKSVCFEGQEEAGDVAAVFVEELSAYLQRGVTAKAGGQKETAGEIRLVCKNGTTETDATAWLGEEGYEIFLDPEGERAEIRAATPRGLRWGCVTFLQLLTAGDSKLPGGLLRDYPRYGVRGFGIDVGRRPVSLDFLYELVRELSAHKMNTLHIHLNDNQIIAESGYDGTVEGAYGLYAGFRLESSVQNEKGEGITSRDLFYTKEEFAKLVADAAAYGVEIVPEIDTPAHSLALTKVFPKLGLSGNPESVDQLDLSKKEARELGKSLWGEYLTPEGAGGVGATAGDIAGPDIHTAGAVFDGCKTLHLGMDEYYGKKEAYLAYLQELTAYMGQLAPDKHLRVWASLSGMGILSEEVKTAGELGLPAGLQMQVWDTAWADPQKTYDAGFSIINSLSSNLYLIPGGGYDRLDKDFLEKEWQPNRFITAERVWELPAWSERMLGANYMLWNDWTFVNGEEITQESLLERIVEPLPVLAGKLWG